MQCLKLNQKPLNADIHPMPHTVSIIIPTFNEAKNIQTVLMRLQRLRQRGHDIIVVDGGSSDETPAIAKPYCDSLLITEASRAKQMNAGADIAKGETLVFLHADTQLPENMASIIESQFKPNHCFWGRFDIKFSSSKWIYRVIAFMMNWRSRITRISTGDQALFINRSLFENIQGYPNLPLMEDIQISKILKKITPPYCLKEKAITSSRRWEKHGVFNTVFLMWYLRLLFFFGVSPSRLVNYYYPKAKKI